MSPSWIERLGLPCVGLALGRGGLRAVLVRERAGRARVEWYRSLPLAWDFPALESNGTPPLDLVPALRVLLEPLAGAYATVQVALPDPCVRMRILDLERPLGSRRRRDEFARWQLSGDVSETGGAVAVATQSLEAAGGPPRLLALGATPALIEVVRSSVRAAGFVPAVVDAGLSYAFNAARDILLASSGGKALMIVEPDSWTCVLADVAGHPRYVRSQWWPGAGGPTHRALAQAVAQVERIIRAFVGAADGVAVERVHLMSAQPWLGTAAALLEARCHGPCLRIPYPAGLALEPDLPPAEASLVAFAAALRR